MNLRKYHGHIQFVPAPGYESYGEPLQHKGGISFSTQDQGNGTRAQRRGYEGPCICCDSLERRFLEGPFISVWLNNVPWAGENIMPASEAKFSDGYLDVVITRECPKSAMLALMLKIADESHVKSPHVMYLKAEAFRLEPGQRVGNPSKGGIIDCDGEVLVRGDGTYHSHQQSANLMDYGPPIDMFVDKGLAAIFSPRR